MMFYHGAYVLKVHIIACYYFSTQTMAQRPISAVGNRRPVSEYAKMAAAMGGNPRYKVIN